MADERKTLTLKCPLAKNGYEGNRCCRISSYARLRCHIRRPVVVCTPSPIVRVFVADGHRYTAL